MDSSASNAVANNKDVPSSMTPTAVEDDGAMSVNSGLAKEAALFFQSGNYADCVRVLYQLLQKKEGDPKVTKSVFFFFCFCGIFIHFQLVVVYIYSLGFNL